MQLTLKILNHTQKGHSQFTFSEEGGSIGRSNDCSWCINGTFISRKHAFIEFKEGRYYIIDNSTNGIGLNNAGDIIQKGVPYKIRNNDLFRIDRFEIIASLDHEDVSQASNADPYAIIEDLPKYISPELDRSADINDPISMSETHSPTAPIKPEIPPPEIPGSLSDIFQVDKPKQDVDEINTTEDDLVIFSVQHNTQPLVETGNPISSGDTNPLVEPEPPETQISPVDTKPFTENTSETVEPTQPKNAELYEMILGGAGIPKPPTPLPNTDEFYRLTGTILHECLQGVIDLLKSRTEVKGHLRLERTVIGQENETNPLKFMPNAEQVMLQSLLNTSNSGYLPISEAVQEAFDDLKSHQFAMSMSVQDALKTTIKHHFSPDKIKEKLEKNRSILSKIPVQREAMLWGMFEDLYSEIEQEAAETFELVLEREIAKAYKLHSMELKYHRKIQKRKK